MSRKRDSLINSSDFEIGNELKIKENEETNNDNHGLDNENIRETGKLQQVSKSVKKEKRKPGRPSTKEEDTKMVNVAVPITLFEKVEIAKTCFDNNVTLYLNTIIEKDITQNYEKYEAIYKQLKEVKLR